MHGLHANEGDLITETVSLLMIVNFVWQVDNNISRLLTITHSLYGCDLQSHIWTISKYLSHDNARVIQFMPEKKFQLFFQG